jgi:hypothetical protein
MPSRLTEPFAKMRRGPGKNSRSVGEVPGPLVRQQDNKLAHPRGRNNVDRSEVDGPYARAEFHEKAHINISSTVSLVRAQAALRAGSKPLDFPGRRALGIRHITPVPGSSFPFPLSQCTGTGLFSPLFLTDAPNHQRRPRPSKPRLTVAQPPLNAVAVSLRSGTHGGDAVRYRGRVRPRELSAVARLPRPLLVGVLPIEKA